jgi:hypothetical protein
MRTYFQQPPKPVPLTARIPLPLKEALERIAQEWTQLAKQRVSVNDVVVRLLEVGAENVSKEIDMNQPKRQRMR